MRYRTGLLPPHSALKRAKLPSDYRFHDLRHTVATLMLANGVDFPTVAAILGHSRNSTTLDIYAHAVPSNLNRAVDALQRALRSARGGSEG
jgi:integrase